MALKVKGAPKAGSKKRRAKAEAEADRIKRAIDEHGTRATATRSATKIRKFTYKPPAERKRKPVLSPSPLDVGLSDRNRRPWHEWEEAIVLADPDKVLSQLETFQMLCAHEALKAEKPIAITADWEAREYRVCPNCQAFLRWYGSYTSTIRAEWMTYRVVGYEMTTWGEFFDKDKSLWPFVLEEAQAALAEED